jgi:hypothetical protein
MKVMPDPCQAIPVCDTLEGAIYAPWSHDSWGDAMASQSGLCHHHPLANNMQIEVLVPFGNGLSSSLMPCG